MTRRTYSVQELRNHYDAELECESGQEALAKLRDRAQQGLITLMFAAHDTEHNNAVVLRDLLLGLKRVRLS